MKNCEFCEDSSMAFIKNKMILGLEKKGINVVSFVESNPETRLRIIIKKFGLEKNGFLKRDELKNFKSKDYGFLIVKPEMYHSSEKVEEFLFKKLNLNILTKKDFIYLPEEYWSIYGESILKNFDGFPHGALIFLIGTTLPSKIFIFEHQSIDSYKKLYRLLNKDKDPDLLINGEEIDRQYVFCNLFAKNSENSIRNSICLPEVSEKGFLKMEENKCPAICWDFTGSFGKRQMKENEYTFNGIHCPRDNKELLLDVAVLSELI